MAKILHHTATTTATTTAPLSSYHYYLEAEAVVRAQLVGQRTRQPIEGAELGEPIQLFRVARSRGVELGDELRHVGEDGGVHARAEHLASG